MPPSLRRFTKSPQARIHDLLHYITTFLTVSLHPSELWAPWLPQFQAATEAKDWASTTGEEILACLFPGHISMAHLMPIQTAPTAVFSPFDAGSQDTAFFSLLLGTYTIFIILCKISSLKPGYGVEVSLSKLSFLGAHKGQNIAPFCSKIFSLITMGL